jgi:hypothetical protein
MFIVSLKKIIIIFGDTIIPSNNILYEVTSVFVFSTDDPIKSLGIKIKYTPRAVVRLVNITVLYVIGRSR